MVKEELTNLLNETVNDAYHSALVDFKNEFDRDNLTNKFCSDFITYFNNSKIGNETLDIPLVRQIFNSILMDSNRVYGDLSEDVDDIISVLTAFVNGERPFDNEVKSAYHNLVNGGYDNDLAEKVKAKIGDSMTISNDDIYDSKADISKMLDTYALKGIVNVTEDDIHNKVYRFNGQALESHIAEFTRCVQRLGKIIDSMSGNSDMPGLLLLIDLTTGFGDYAKQLSQKEDKSPDEELFLAEYKKMLAIRKAKRDSILKIVMTDDAKGNKDRYINIMLPLIENNVVSIEDGKYKYQDYYTVQKLIAENPTVQKKFYSVINMLYTTLFNDITYCSPVNYDMYSELTYAKDTDGILKGMVRYILFLNQAFTRKYIEEFIGKDSLDEIDNLFKMFMLSYTMFKAFDGKVIECNDKTEGWIEKNIGVLINQLGFKTIQTGYVFNPDMLFTSKRPITEFDKYVAKNVTLYDMLSDFTIKYNQIAIDVEDSETHDKDLRVLRDAVDQINDSGDGEVQIYISPLLSDSTIKFDEYLLKPHILPDFYKNMIQILNYYTGRNEAIITLIHNMLTEVSDAVLDSDWSSKVKIFSKLISKPKENLNNILAFGVKNGLVDENNGSYVINVNSESGLQLKYIKELEKYCVYSNMVVFGRQYFTKAQKYMYEYYDIVSDLLKPYMDSPELASKIDKINDSIQNIKVALRR